MKECMLREGKVFLTNEQWDGQFPSPDASLRFEQGRIHRRTVADGWAGVVISISISISIYFPLNSKSETITMTYGKYQSSQEGGQQKATRPRHIRGCDGRVTINRSTAKTGHNLELWLMDGPTNQHGKVWRHVLATKNITRIKAFLEVKIFPLFEAVELVTIRGCKVSFLSLTRGLFLAPLDHWQQSFVLEQCWTILWRLFRVCGMAMSWWLNVLSLWFKFCANLFSVFVKCVKRTGGYFFRVAKLGPRLSFLHLFENFNLLGNRKTSPFVFCSHFFVIVCLFDFFL